MENSPKEILAQIEVREDMEIHSNDNPLNYKENEMNEIYKEINKYLEVGKMLPIEPKTARAKLDCIARKDKVINDAFDHLRDGQITLALRVLAAELGLE